MAGGVPVKYALLIWWNEVEGLARPTSEDRRELAAHGAFVQTLGPRLLGGQRLEPERRAARVRVRGGRRSITDGPFAETKEVLGGFYLIECATRDEALDWAARCPSAEHGTVEVRPIWEPRPEGAR
jgi:hypothetical protein